MMLFRFSKIRTSVVFFTFLISVVVLGCGPIQLIAPYDQKTDEAVTNLQKMTAEFFTQIERQGGSNPEDYKNHTKFYDDVKVALSGCIVRVNAISNNKVTFEQLKILKNQFTELEKNHHEIGLEQAAIPVFESAFNKTFRMILLIEVAKKEPKE